MRRHTASLSRLLVVVALFLTPRALAEAATPRPSLILENIGELIGSLR